MKKWVKVEDVSRLRDGQRIRMYTGSSFDCAISRIGADDSPRVFRKADSGVLRDPSHYAPKDCTVSSPLSGWLYLGYTVEALEEEVDERTRIAKVWDELNLKFCEAVLQTPTQCLSDRQWAVMELAMRELTKIPEELKQCSHGGSDNRSAQNGGEV